MSDLSHHHALITGGGSGIGLAIAKAFLAQGARVTISGRSQQRLDQAIEKLGAGLGIQGDVSEPEDIVRVVGRAHAASGPVTCLVNNAGIAESRAFAEADEEHWDRTVAINLTGAYRMTRALLEDLLAAEDGRIINIASTAGLRGFAFIAAYTASKHGLVGLTKSLAIEFAETRLTVNAICPGFTDTAMAENAITNVMKLTGRERGDVTKRLLSNNPQGRLIDPVEVAAAACWLAGRDASSVNGATIPISGGEIT